MTPARARRPEDHERLRATARIAKVSGKTHDRAINQKIKQFDNAQKMMKQIAPRRRHAGDAGDAGWRVRPGQARPPAGPAAQEVQVGQPGQARGPAARGIRASGRAGGRGVRGRPGSGTPGAPGALDPSAIDPAALPKGFEKFLGKG